MRPLLPALALVLTLTSGAAAQQHAPIPGKMFPMSATAFDVYVQKALARIRSLRPAGPVTQADINQGLLLFRDCAANAEADGAVTQGEFNYCSKVMQDFMREKMHEIMLSGTPEQWKQWMQQAAAANR